MDPDSSTSMTSTYTMSTVTKPHLHLTYATDLDTLYGVLYCLCFLLGLSGNLISLSYFVTRKRDLPNTLYRIITATDAVTSILSLAVAITFLSEREPGPVFGSPLLCNAWAYVWHVTSRLSIFLVVVLSGSRTYYLNKPFNQQRLGPSLALIALYTALQVSQTVGFQFQHGTGVRFVEPMARCALLFEDTADKNLVLYMDVVRILTIVLPMFVVFLSSLMSIRITLARIDQSIRHGSGRGELRRSRNRATITILLFTLVYAAFNVPLVVSEILHTVDYHTDYRFDFHSFDYQHKYILYYDNFVSLLSVSLNAAINPLLYLWRMPSCRVFMLEKGTPRMRQGKKRASVCSSGMRMHRLEEVNDHTTPRSLQRNLTSCTVRENFADILAERRSSLLQGSVRS